MTSSTTVSRGVRGSAAVGSRALRSSGTGARVVLAIAEGWGRWARRHPRWALGFALLALLAALTQPDPAAARVLITVAALPGLVVAVWEYRWPAGYQRWLAGPSRRFGWRRWARRIWPVLARECGLSVQRNVRRRTWALARRNGRVQVSSTGTASEWVPPRLVDILTTGDTLTLRVRARMGQTVQDLEAAAPALAAAASAVSYRVRQWTPSVLDIALVVREALAATSEAQLPGPLGHDLAVDTVTLGRRQDDTPWALQVRGRHTLVVGCSGSGKGSMLWGVCGGLAPAVRADLVRLWGVDLKRGVEVMMGRHLFTTVAITPSEAVATLTRLLQVVEDRGHAMAGVSRLHRPRPGDPLHVLVIDELAALTAYTDPDTKREASRLLAEILTQGRALGVVVLACVQDPRKEVVGMRGLFTQTIALRLRSAEETRMVLGDGTAALAPAHRLSPAAPGSAWVVEEDGTLDRVRADYWPDQLVRETAATYPALVVEETTGEAPVVTQPDDEMARADVASSPTPRTPRPARATRAPRQARSPRERRPREGADPGSSVSVSGLRSGSGDRGPEAA
ncbi:FtsK/SpoIIIE domain-containing protein [Terrabacter carboxydivorans]|uniref:FtsK domain-containing protein n=1 Tax=Terrabacter carboxydivorans TaxID=619730 RepID=A0ABN3M7V4_9MICO